ncbi:MAG: choline dehydrogenase [Albidovulum sp.]|jgi:choline dehydrogenase|uniref:choline dehydrogenase n=1 Tax=Albidovulum sp. TaxID=1872424 RepID=UPI003C84AF65
MKKAFDFIVVGAGSAGCAVAARLSERPGLEVLLIEAGPDANPWTIRMPLAVDRLLNGTTYNWQFGSEPEPGLQGRAVAHPRGRVVGGSSAINGMVYTRGHPLDFDDWRDRYGCTGWGYADVLPYFRRMETAPGGSSRYRGGDGPLKVTRPDPDSNPLNAAFIAAGRELGHPVTDDYNGPKQEGFAVGEQSILRGERRSTAVSYLTSEVRRRPNLTILPDCLVERIDLEGKEAVGVTVRVQGAARAIRARREVILSAGAIGSPHLLMLSGIGPGSVLKAAEIPVVLDRPAVGRNLQDHPDLVIQFGCRQPVTLQRYTSGLGRIVTGVKWFAMRRGVAASNQFEVAAYLRTRSGLRKPNIKLEFFPLAISHADYQPYPQEAFQIHMTLMDSAARGEVSLRSADAATAPVLRFNYLNSDTDMQTFREAVALTRRLVQASAFAPFAGPEMDPGAEVQSDAALNDWIRSRVSTAYHPSCTCRMGAADDPQAVVAPDLRVYGIAGLRVADASVMPHIVAANTNATTIMIGERAADLALDRPQLPPDRAPYWTGPGHSPSGAE